MDQLEERFRIHVASGLHARVAMRFAVTAAAFHSAIEVERAGKAGNGKNALAVLMLVAGPDDEIVVRAKGPDAEEALAALTELVEVELGAIAGAAPIGELSVGVAAR